jgi:tRNA nucleotidyltransferase (CCA-adding enzyme)
MNEAKIEEILQKVLKDIVPSESEKKKVDGIINFAKTSVGSEISKQKVDADIVVGGSIGKDTWLAGTADIDFFIRFNKKHADERIDELLGKIIKSVFQDVLTVHGSRDYYRITYKGYVLEFVPVLKIAEPSEAENSMDASPFHIDYVKRHSRINNLGDQVRLLKAFAKAQGFYGAETHTAGLSGYASELLMVHYGSFYKLVEALEIVQPKLVIDIEKHYKDADTVLITLTEAKLRSPLILIDPVLKSRNAAAALDYSTFGKMLFSLRMFLREPSLNFFHKKEHSFERIKEESKKRGTILVDFELKLREDVHEDVFLSKLQRKIEQIHSKLEREGIEVYSFGYTEKGSKIKVYFEIATLKLSKYFKHFGPPVWVVGTNFDEFISKHKNVYVDSGSLVVDLKRKYADIAAFALSLLKEELKDV